jgi:D-alanyl-D-alanine carboxypeptidase
VLLRSADVRDCFPSFGSTTVHGDDPIELDDQIRIGSSTTMTGTVVLQSVQEGRAPADPVSAHHLGVPNGGTVTIRHLLEMRSGRADVDAQTEGADE